MSKSCSVEHKINVIIHAQGSGAVVQHVAVMVLAVASASLGQLFGALPPTYCVLRCRELDKNLAGDRTCTLPLLPYYTELCKYLGRPVSTVSLDAYASVEHSLEAKREENRVWGGLQTAFEAKRFIQLDAYHRGKRPRSPSTDEKRLDADSFSQPLRQLPRLPPKHKVASSLPTSMGAPTSSSEADYQALCAKLLLLEDSLEAKREENRVWERLKKKLQADKVALENLVELLAVVQ